MCFEGDGLDGLGLQIMEWTFDYDITLFPAPVYAALESQFEPCQQETMSAMESDFDENCKMNYSQKDLDQMTKNGEIAARIMCLKNILIDTCADYVESDLFYQLQSMSWMA